MILPTKEVVGRSLVMIGIHQQQRKKKRMLE
jgi:hypothetical protein